MKKYNAALREAAREGYRCWKKERAAGLKEKDEAVRRYREELSREVAGNERFKSSRKSR